MERGTYSAATGGLLQLRKLDVVNNNLANINTVGFKRELIVGDKQQFSDTLASQTATNDPFAQGDHERNAGVTNVRAVTDFSLGSFKATGNPLDAALRNPNDFFVVNTAQGQLYTRAGNFTLNDAGELVAQDGAQVLGDGGPIAVNGAGATIAPDGSVKAGGAVVGKLQVMRFEGQPPLEHVGGTRFKLTQGAQPPAAVEPELESGTLEMANVSSISSMVELMTTNRAFDQYNKAATTIDQMNQTAITQYGRRA